MKNISTVTDNTDIVWNIKTFVCPIETNGLTVLKLIATFDKISSSVLIRNGFGFASPENCSVRDIIHASNICLRQLLFTMTDTARMLHKRGVQMDKINKSIRQGEIAPHLLFTNTRL